MELEPVNWALIISVAAPAYGTMYLWLVKIAREDPVLYQAIEFRIFSTVSALLIVSVGAAIGFWIRANKLEDVSRQYAVLFVLTSFLLAYTVSSKKFFREVTMLPSKKRPPEP